MRQAVGSLVEMELLDQNEPSRNCSRIFNMMYREGEWITAHISLPTKDHHRGKIIVVPHNSGTAKECKTFTEMHVALDVDIAKNALQIQASYDDSGPWWSRILPHSGL